MKRFLRSSRTQLLTMVEYIEKHRELEPYPPDTSGRLEYMRKWKKLTNLLNNDISGIRRPSEKWKKVWYDLKGNIKKKYARMKEADKFGNKVLVRITPLEERVLTLLGLPLNGLPLNGLPLNGLPLNGLPMEEPADHAEEEQEITVVTIKEEEPDPDVVEVVVRTSPLQPISPPAPTPQPVSLNEGNETQDEPNEQPSYNQPAELEDQPDPSRETTPRSDRSPVRCSHRVPRESRLSQNHRRPRHLRRTFRPTLSEDSQLVHDSNREWRDFLMEQQRQNLDLRREELRIRKLEIETQMKWQAVAVTALGLIEDYLNRN